MPPNPSAASRLLPLILLARAAAAGPPAQADVLGMGSLLNWSVECHNGWRDEGFPWKCMGPSGGELRQARGPAGPALEFKWDLGSSDWTQAVRVFPQPLDLSGMAALRLDVRGIAPVGVDVQLTALFADVNGVFYGRDLFDPSAGIQLADRWQARFSLAQSTFTYRFNIRGRPPSAIDWSRISRFYLAVVRPCVGAEGDPARVCFGGGSGRVFVDRWEIRRGAPEPGDAAGLERIILWKEDFPPAGEPLWDQEDAPLGAGAAARPGVGPSDRWQVECDGGAWPQQDPARCRGLAAGDISATADGGAPRLRLLWNMDAGEWVQVRHSFETPVDLSGAQALGLSLEGSGTPGAGRALGIMLADVNDVFYAYDLDLSHMNFQGRWRINLALTKESFYYHFNMRGGGSQFDWSRVGHLFFGVKRLPGGTRAMAGALDFAHFQVRAPAGRARPADSPSPRRGPPEEDRWGYAIYFAKDDDAVPAVRRADLEKVAEHLRLYRDHDVLVIGFADGREAGADRLAEERGKNVAALLVKENGAPLERIHVTVSPSRTAFQGERLEKVVIRFLGKGELKGKE